MPRPNIVNFSDFHAHLWQDFAKPDALYTTDRFKKQLDVLEEVFSYAEENEADILFNGDLFHKRTNIDVRVFNYVYDLFRKHKETTVYMIRGNHDSVTNSLYSPSSLEPFEALENVQVVSTLGKIETPCYDIYGVGYGEETDVAKEWIANQVENLSEEKVNILCAHIGVSGSVTGKYSHTLDGAFSLSDLYPEKFDIVTLGHYHKRQFLGGYGNVFYVGNTLQTSFSDEGQDKGFYFIAIDGKKWVMNFVKTSYTPFVTINAENAPENLEGAYYQFVGNVEESRAVKDLQEDSDLSNVRISVQKDYSEAPRIDIKAGSSPQEVTRKYVNKDYPKLESKALEIIQEAQQTI